MKNGILVVGGLAIVGAFGWYMYLQSSKSFVDEKGQKYERTLKRGLPKDLSPNGQKPTSPPPKQDSQQQKAAPAATPAAVDKPKTPPTAQPSDKDATGTKPADPKKTDAAADKKAPGPATP